MSMSAPSPISAAPRTTACCSRAKFDRKPREVGILMKHQRLRSKEDGRYGPRRAAAVGIGLALPVNTRGGEQDANAGI
jgi:hypothetical protein